MHKNIFCPLHIHIQRIPANDHNKKKSHYEFHSKNE